LILLDKEKSGDIMVKPIIKHTNLFNNFKTRNHGRHL
jgi:hypothetical protein